MSYHQKGVDKGQKPYIFPQNFNFNFQLYLLFDKRKIQNGRFPQTALASRGGKQQERIGLHYSLSNLDKV